jgi:hypothetical protein
VYGLLGMYKKGDMVRFLATELRVPTALRIGRLGGCSEYLPYSEGHCRLKWFRYVHTTLWPLF